MDYHILTINPGSTSTKVGFFRCDTPIFSASIQHSAEELSKFPQITDQLSYRTEVILNRLEQSGIDLSTVDAFVGRGGGLLSVEGGTYAVDALLLDHARRGANGVQHPAQLGSLIAYSLAEPYGKPCFVVNPPDTDELTLCARLTGIKNVYRHVHLHALNLKETAIRHSTSQGRCYEDCRYIVCHIGGGISISAHDHGKMIDGFDIVGGEGPMAPTRCGAVPIAELLKLFRQSGEEAIRPLLTKTGGFVSHLGTSDAKLISQRAAEGDARSKLVWDTMLYQIIRCIGAMAGVLHGNVDGILLGGGMVHNPALVQAIRQGCGWIAPVYAYPGEFEMEAMAAGALRVLSGQEQAKRYTGRPAWTPDSVPGL